MAKKKNSNKGWILGSVLGAIGGAAYALWKTPMSGRQLRSKVAPGTTGGSTSTHTESGFGTKVMSKVEHTLAPIVGVQLGKTANRTGDAEAVTVSNTTVYTANGTSTEGTTMATPPDSINEKRWAWGSPAPERNEVDDSKFQAAETAQVEPNQPESVTDADTGPFAASGSNATPGQEDNPVVATSSNATPAFGDNTIRGRRFAWGDPAPETATAPPATEFNATPAAMGVTPEQAPAGASLTDAGETANVNSPSAPVAINPDHTQHGTSLTTPSPEQRVVPTSAADATAPVGSGGEAYSANVDDTLQRSVSGHSTGKMNPFPNLGGLED